MLRRAGVGNTSCFTLLQNIVFETYPLSIYIIHSNSNRQQKCTTSRRMAATPLAIDGLHCRTLKPVAAFKQSPGRGHTAAPHAIRSSQLASRHGQAQQLGLHTPKSPLLASNARAQTAMIVKAAAATQGWSWACLVQVYTGMAYLTCLTRLYGGWYHQPSMHTHSGTA